ncbi:hypothetical protein ACFL6Y_01945 [Elusimicrobiota bacterium]
MMEHKIMKIACIPFLVLVLTISMGSSSALKAEAGAGHHDMHDGGGHKYICPFDDNHFWSKRPGKCPEHLTVLQLEENSSSIITPIPK